MSNEQRAHDLTMYYVKILCNMQRPDKDNTVKLDPYAKYVEIYAEILEKVNRDFPNNQQ